MRLVVVPSFTTFSWSFICYTNFNQHCFHCLTCHLAGFSWSIEQRFIRLAKN
ncbi:hypothetical protein BJV74DRAFT_235528 [Russula compacta]|nr:hypothetical protein BJV74DRAFT_235528 [Russula compacta]